MKKKPKVDPYKAATGDDNKFLAVMIKQSKILATGVSKMTAGDTRYWLRSEKGRLEKDFVIQIHLMGAFAGMRLAGAKRPEIIGKAKKLFAAAVRTNFIMSMRWPLPSAQRSERGCDE